MRTISKESLENENTVINDQSISSAEIVVEFEDGDDEEQVVKSYEEQDLHPVFIQFVEFTSNLTNNELNEMAVYSTGIAGMAYRIVELTIPVNCI